MLEHQEVLIKYIDFFIEKDLQNLTLNFSDDSFLYFTIINERIFNIHGLAKDYAKQISELREDAANNNIDSYEYYDLKNESFKTKESVTNSSTIKKIKEVEIDNNDQAESVEEEPREIDEEELQNFRERLVLVLDKAKTVFDSINDNDESN